jgi:glycosyltransferase involved in cell wall biosynthesis
MDFLLTGGMRSVFDDEAEALGARLYYLPFRRRKLWGFSREFRNILQANAYDALHDHQDYASGWHYLLGLSQLPPYRITHVHNPSYQIRNNYGITLSRRLAAIIGRSLVRTHATHVLGTSRQILDEYGFLSPKFSRLQKDALHCGFDPARFAGNSIDSAHSLRAEFGWKKEMQIILFAGRIDQSPDPRHPQTHKNSGFAVDVAIEAALRNPHLCMILAGKPSPATSVLERRVARLGSLVASFLWVFAATFIASCWAAIYSFSLALEKVSAWLQSKPKRRAYLYLHRMQFQENV